MPRRISNSGQRPATEGRGRRRPPGVVRCRVLDACPGPGKQGDHHDAQIVVGDLIRQRRIGMCSHGDRGGEISQLSQPALHIGVDLARGVEFVTQFDQHGRHASAAIDQHLADQQVDGLDLVRALVDHRHARIAHDLLDAPFADIAVAPKTCRHSLAPWNACWVQAAFSTGVTSAHQRWARSRTLAVGIVACDVELDGGAVGDHSGSIDPGALRVEDAADGWMLGHEVGGFAPRLQGGPGARIWRRSCA